MHSIMFFLLFSIFLGNISSLNIHVIPHSHMDPGWLRTYEEYYNQQVKKIFSNVYDQMKSNANRTFVFCEMINFERWYNSQSEEVKTTLKKWLNEGRIEFVGGGLVMNDEASSFYKDIIDQMRVGMQFIIKEFGTVPKVGWMLDPFGHSPTNALIHSQLGYPYLVIERIEYQEHDDRIKHGNMEFLWRPYNNDRYRSIFTHLLPYHYGNSFYYKFLSEERAIPTTAKIDNLSIELIKLINKVRSGFKHKQNFLFLLGDDFTFMNGDYLYKRMEALMAYINNNQIEKETFNIFYSTPSKYFEAVEKEIEREKIKLHIETDIDFFPYADQPYAYWTGYFTSRPYLKGTAKYLANLFLTSSNLFFELQMNSKLQTGNLIELQKIIGLLQHHDAITGTAKDRVSNDYISLANSQDRQTQQKIINLLKNLGEPVEGTVKICLNNPIINYGCDNEFSLEEKNESDLLIGLINPGIKGKTLITIEMRKASKQYSVYSQNNTESIIQSDFFCVNTKDFKYNNTCFLNFFYEFDPNIIITSFILRKSLTSPSEMLPYPKEKMNLVSGEKRIKSLDFDPISNTYEIMIYQDYIQKYNFSLYHGFFAGFSKRERSTIRPSNANADGAYIFAPIDPRPTKFEINPKESMIYRGKISTSVITRYTSFTYMISTFFYDPLFAKIESIIDPITSSNNKTFILGVDSDIDNEITVQYNTSNGLHKNETQAEFWTDSNGVQMMRRVVNYKHNYNHTFNEKVAINFYPVTTAMSIRSKTSKFYNVNKYAYLTPEDRMLTMFSDRPQSGGALRKGEMMLMLLRSGLVDDCRGVAERLYETMSSRSYFKITNLMMFGKTMLAKDPRSLDTLNFVYNFMHNTPMLFKANQMKKFKPIYSFISQMFFVSKNVVQNIQILNDKDIIVQFYHRYDYYFENENEKTGGLVSIRVDRGKKVKMSVDYNGVSCLNLDKQMNKVEYNGFLRKQITNLLDIELMQNDFIFVRLIFDKL